MRLRDALATAAAAFALAACGDDAERETAPASQSPPASQDQQPEKPEDSRGYGY